MYEGWRSGVIYLATGSSRQTSLLLPSPLPPHLPPHAMPPHLLSRSPHTLACSLLPPHSHSQRLLQAPPPLALPQARRLALAPEAAEALPAAPRSC